MTDGIPLQKDLKLKRIYKWHPAKGAFDARSFCIEEEGVS